MARCPVELFSNHGLGTSNSSLDRIGAVLPSAKIGQAQLSCSVNVNTGNLVFRDHTIQVVEENFPLNFGYVYNHHLIDGSINHWRQALTRKIFLMPSEKDPANMIIENEDGKLITLNFDSTRNVYLSEKESSGREIARFDQKKNQWIIYNTETHAVEIYDYQGFLLSREDAAGRRTNYEYTNGILSAIVGPLLTRYEIRQSHNEIGAVEQIVEIVGGQETLLHIHQFDQIGRLVSTKPSVDGYKVEYHYVGDTWEFDSIVQDDRTVLKVGIQADKVSSVEISGPQDNHQFRYNVAYNNDPTAPVIFTDSAQISTKIYVDKDAQITKVEKPKGFTPADKDIDTTEYEYLDQQVKKITYTDKSIETFEHDPMYGVMIQNKKPDGKLIDYHYEPNIDRPKLSTRVEWLDSKTPLVTRYVYDNDWDETGQQHAFLRFELTPSGSVHEMRPDKHGNIHSSRQYAHEKYVQVMDLPPHLAPSLGGLSNWVSNLQNRWKQNNETNQINLSEFGYDLRGQVQEKIDYSSVDNEGNGNRDGVFGQELTQWDRYGNWQQKNTLKTQGQTSTTIRQYHDSLVRLTAEIQDPQGLNLTTTYGYNDAQQYHTVSLPNGRKSTTTLNALGQDLRNVTTAENEKKEIETRTTRVIRDSDGRPIKHFMTDGKITYEFYDKEQQLGFTVSRTGLVVETYHDTKNRFKKSVQYEQRINPDDMYLSNPPGENDLPNFFKFQQLLNAIKQNNKNRTAYKFFDTMGRLRYEVNTANIIIETRYDAVGRKVATIEYSNPISDADLENLKLKKDITLSVDFTKDRVHQTIYTIDGNVFAEIDAGGYVTQNIRNSANQIIETVQFSTNIPPANRSLNIELTFLMPPQNGDDAHTYFFRDSRGQVAGQVNPDRSVVVNEYFSCGKLAKQTQYVKKVDKSWFSESSKKPPVITDDPDDLIIKFQYDNLLRETDKNASNDYCDHTEFNNMGKVKNKRGYDQADVNSTDPTKQRSQQMRYDGWEQVTKEANEYVSQYMLENPNKSQEIWNSQSLRHYYDNTGLQLKNINPMGGITFYFYDQERRPIITVNSRGVVTENTLNSFGEVEITRVYNTKLTDQQFKDLTGGVATQQFLSFLHDQLASDKDHITRQPRNNLGQVYQHVDPNENVSTYQYNAFGQVEEENLPVDSKNPSLTVIHEYEARGLEVKTTKKTEDLTTIERKEYNNFLGKQTATIDPTECKTQTEYDKIGRLKKSINGLEITTQALKRDGRGRVKTETDALDNVTEHSFDQKTRVQTTTFPVTSVVKKLTRDVFDQTIQSEDAMSNKRTWGYDPTGKQSKFKNASLKESTVKRDLNGREEQSTDHNGVVTKNVLDSMGNILEVVQNYHDDSSENSRTTHNTFDAFDQKETVTNNKGILTKQQFDKNGSVTQITVDSGEAQNNLNIISASGYNAQNALVDETIGDNKTQNQWDKKILRDSLGRKIGEVIDPNGLALTTRLHLDLAGRTTAKVDANGNITRFFYDTAGNERFKIGPRGDVTETEYDKNSRPKSIRTYENKIDITLSDETSLQQVIDAMSGKSTADDAIVWTFYDANGREVFVVNANGYVIESGYDNASNKISNKLYYKNVDPSSVPGLTTDQLSELMKTKVDEKHDRITYTMYDDAQRERIHIDGNGYVVLRDYDAQGNEITVSCFSTKLENPEVFSKLPIDQAIAGISRDTDRDRVSYHVYNEFNEQIFNVDPEGNVIRYDFDEVGNQTTTSSYKQRIESLPLEYDQLVNYLKNQLPAPTNENSRITTKKYDNANRVQETVDEYGKSDVFTLDALGQRKTHKDRVGGVWTYQYDRAKRNTHEISPKVNVTFVTQETVDNEAVLTSSVQNINIVKRYDHDNNGNKTTIVVGDGTSQARSYTNHYNETNDLSGIENKNVVVNDETKNADFINRPEKTLASISTNKIFNMKNKVVVDVNQLGERIFHVYDASNREIYLVNENKGVVKYQRNAFNEVEAQIVYDTAIQINLSDYEKTGIPLSVIKPLIKTSVKDRYEKVTYDKVGNKTVIEKGPVSSYNCTGAETAPNFQENTYTNTTQSYNAFGQVFSQKKLMDPTSGTTTEELTWYDRNGNELITATKKDTDQTSYFVIRKMYNSFNQEENRSEYAKEVSSALNPQNTTVAEIDNLVSQHPSSDDRHFKTEYNQAGKKQSETRVNVTYQELDYQEGGKPKQKILQGDLSKNWQYDDMQRPVVLEYEDGQKEFTYYDPTGVVVATVGVERETVDESGTRKVSFPLTDIGRDVAGDEVKRADYYNGTTVPDPTKMPIPALKDPTHDQISLTLRGNRGEEMVKQNPEVVMVNQRPVNILRGFTYTALKDKLARNFHWTTNFEQLAATQYQDVRFMDEQRLFYDEMSNLKQIWTVRDGKKINWQTNTLNIFGDVIAESINDRAPYIFRKFDNVGNLWMSNSYNQGATTIVLHDLAGNETCQIDSDPLDLSKTEYSGLSSIINLPAGQIDKTERIFDARNHARTVFEPETLNLTSVFQRRDISETDVVPLSMVISNQDGKTTMSWVLPQERIFKPVFTIWPYNNPNAINTLDLVYEDNRVFVDLSNFTSDVYEYKMSFPIEDPDTHDVTEIFHTSGTLVTDGEVRQDCRVQIDTGHNVGSLSLVAIVQDQSTLKLTGNITNLTAIDLYQGSTKISTVPINQQPVNGALTVNLDTYTTGTYTVKPARNDVSQDEESVPFTIYTAKTPEDKPVVREIPFKVATAFLEEYGQLVLGLPIEFVGKEIKLSIAYTDSEDKELTEDIEITDPSFFEFYEPGNDQSGFAYNIKLEKKLKTLKNISVQIKVNDTQWLPLLSGAQPLQNLIVLPNPPHQQQHFERLYQDSLVFSKNTKENNVNPSPDILTFSFMPRQIIHIQNVPSLTSQPDITFKDMTQDRLADWHGLDLIGFTEHDVTFDISGMQPGVYPFYINIDKQTVLEDQYFTVSGNAQIYACDGYFDSETLFDAYIRAMKLGLMSTNAKKDVVLSAKLPDGSAIQFNELAVKPDGDCGFTVLGIPAKQGKHPRAYFAHFLSSLSSDRESRENLAEEIRREFLLSEFVSAPHPQEWEMLMRRLDISSDVKNKHRAQVIQELGLHHLTDSEEYEFLQALKEASFEKYVEFNNYRLTEFNVEQDITRYCTRKDVYLHYVQAYPKGMWMGFQSALLYAKKHNLSLHIWSKQNDENLRYEVGHDAGSTSRGVIHMLQTDGGTHFNLLQVSDQQNKKDITHEIGRRASLVAQKTRRKHRFTHDAWGNAITQTDPEGNTTTNAYNDENTMVSQTSAPVTVLKGGTATTTKKPLTTAWGFNKRGFNVYKQDPSGNTEGYLLNKANQLLADILSDGTKSIEQALDIFANRVVYKDAVGNEYKQKFNRERQLTESTLPGGSVIKNTYGENKMLRQQTSSGSNPTRYNYSENADVSDSFMPGGQHTTMTYNYNHKMTSQTNPAPNGGSLSWVLDDFGNAKTHTNLSGITFETRRNFKNQPIKIHQTAGQNPQPNWGLNTQFGSKISGYGWIFKLPWRNPIGGAPVPAQNLVLTYNGGLLTELQDVTNGKTSWYLYNGNNDKTSITVKGSNNELIQQISTQYDPLRREVWSFDTMFICQTWFDENGNRGRIRGLLYDRGPDADPKKTDYWNTFGLSNQQIFDGGVWNPDTKQVELSPTQGIKYIYDVNARRSAQQYRDASGYHTVNLNYYTSGYQKGLLQSTSVDTGLTTQYAYTSDLQIGFYSQTNPPGSKNQNMTSNSNIDVNGWTRSDIQVSNSINDDRDHLTTTTTVTFSDFRGTGDANHQQNYMVTVNHDGDNPPPLTDEISRILIGMDTWKLGSLSVTRSNKYGANSSIATNQYDSNGQIAAQIGVNDPNNKDPKNPRSINYFYTNTPDALTVKKSWVGTSNNVYGPFGFNFGTPYSIETRFFYSASMEILGTYERAVNPGLSIPKMDPSGFNKPYMNFIKSGVFGGKGANLGYDATAGGWLSSRFGSIFGHNNPFGNSGAVAGYDAKRGGWVSQANGGSLTIVDRMQPIGMLWCSPRGYMFGDKFGNEAAQSLQGTNPWISGSTYTVQPGDSWEKIARSIYGDGSYGSLIAGMNGRSGSQDVLIAGQKLRIPQFVPTHNNDKTSLPFYLLLSIVYESLYPALKTPQPKKHWWQIFVMIIAIVVAAIVAPELVGFLGAGFTAAFGGSVILSEAVVGAVIAGVIDAAGQGVLVLGGLDTFSWTFLLQAVIGGGMGAAFSGGNVFNVTGSKLANLIITKGIANITQQLLEMAVGIRKQLDLKSVASAMATAGFNAKVNLPIDDAVAKASPNFTQAMQNAFQSVSDSFITQAITGEKIDFAMLGVQFIGQKVGAYIGAKVVDYINPQPISKPDLTTREQSSRQERLQYSNPATYQEQQQYQAQRATVTESQQQVNQGSANSKQTRGANNHSASAVNQAAVNPALNPVTPQQLLKSLPEDSIDRLLLGLTNDSDNNMCIYKPQEPQVHSATLQMASTPSVFERLKLSAYNLLQRVNDSPITQKLANNVVTDNLVKASLWTNRMGAEGVHNIAQGAQDTYHHPGLALANLGIGLYNNAIDTLDFLTGSTPEYMHGHLHVTPYSNGTVGTDVATVISILGPGKFIPKSLGTVRTVSTENLATSETVAREVASLRTISQNVQNNRILNARISARQTVNLTGQVEVIRVEGNVNQRLMIDSSKNASILPDNKSMLFLNFGNKERAYEYLAQKQMQRPDFTMKSFLIDTDAFLRIRLSSVPQHGGYAGTFFKKSPQIVDLHTGPEQYGIRINDFNTIQQSIIPNSGFEH